MCMCPVPWAVGMGDVVCFLLGAASLEGPPMTLSAILTKSCVPVSWDLSVSDMMCCGPPSPWVPQPQRLTAVSQMRL